MGAEPTPSKKFVKMGIFPNRGENKKIFELPPPSFSNGWNDSPALNFRHGSFFRRGMKVFFLGYFVGEGMKIKDVGKQCVRIVMGWIHQ